MRPARSTAMDTGRSSTQRARPAGRLALAHAAALALLVTLVSVALPGGAHADEPADTATEPAPREPFRQALLIGVWDYDHNDYDLGSFEANLLALQSAFDAYGFDRVVEPLRNPTAQQIIDAVNAAAKDASELEPERSALTVIYFIGHGTMVGHGAYLLGRDFRRPPHVSEITEYGGVQIDYLADVLGRTGQPAFLIIEACRNPLVADPDAPPPDPSATPAADAGPMIAPPSRYRAGQAVFYAQRPGGLVELIREDLRQPTPLVAALASIQAVREDYNEVNAMTAAVSTQVIATTGAQRYPAHPQLVQQGASGQLFLRYSEDERSSDARRWQRTREAGSYQTFIAAYATSPFVPVAKWLDRRRAQSNIHAKAYIAYSGEVQELLGRSPRWFERGPDRANTRYSLRTTTGDRLVDRDILAMRRNEDGEGFEGRTMSGEIVLLSKVVLPSLFDASKIPEFWALGDVEAIACPAEDILSGQCPALEAAAAVALAGAQDKTGSVFVASIVDTSGDGRDVETMLDRLNAARLRLRTLGAEDLVLFRNFYRYELPDAPGSLLLKRGDGAPLSSE